MIRGLRYAKAAVPPSWDRHFTEDGLRAVQLTVVGVLANNQTLMSAVSAFLNSLSIDKPLVCIGICTRRRPMMLENLLESIARLVLPVDVHLVGCVVENDSRDNQRALVERFAARLSWPLAYCQEPRIGIPQARNRLLDHALGLGATALVLVDDDEEVTSDWLQALCTMAAGSHWQAVIQGRVISRVQDPRQQHYERFFQRKPRISGQSLNACASNNTLVPLAEVARLGLRFDEHLSDVGGEDTVFFSAARRAGISLLYCQEAVVTEVIPPTRANLRWLSQRKFRVGLMLGSGALAGKPRSILKSLAYGLRAVAGTLPLLWWLLRRRRVHAVKTWLTMCRDAGRLMGYFRVSVRPYQRVHGY